LEPEDDSCPDFLRKPLAECYRGSCRRDLLDHLIALHERHLNGCSASTFPTTKKIARILDSGGKRRLAGFRARHPAASLLMHDQAVCIIATIGLHDPSPRSENQTLFAILYICAASARGPFSQDSGLFPAHWPSAFHARNTNRMASSIRIRFWRGTGELQQNTGGAGSCYVTDFKVARSFGEPQVYG
jgi:hypothetical protein